MKLHHGMRPHDLLVLLKIICLNNPAFKLVDLSKALGISLSEVSDSITRSVFARLLAPDKKTPQRKAIMDFIVYGLPYVFPVQPGPLVVGIPTAHSAPPLISNFGAGDPVVWSDPNGNVKGQEIIPYHPKQIYAAGIDSNLYELLILTDALRMGRARERNLAEVELAKRILA